MDSKIFKFDLIQLLQFYQGVDCHHHGWKSWVDLSMTHHDEILELQKGWTDVTLRKEEDSDPYTKPIWGSKMHEVLLTATQGSFFVTNGHHAKQDEFLNGCNCSFWRHSNHKCFWKNFWSFWNEGQKKV